MARIVVAMILAFLLFTSAGQTIGMVGLIWAGYEVGLFPPLHTDPAVVAAEQAAREATRQKELKFFEWVRKMDEERAAGRAVAANQ
jgi:hypothetical protein